MVSVTSDVTASANFQNAPPKLALPDPSQLTGGFASLVDSNLAADPSSMLPPAPAPEPPASPHAMRNQNTSVAPRNNSDAPGNNTQGANQNPPAGGAPSDNSSGTNQTQPATTGADQNDGNAQQSTTTAKDGTSKAGGDKSTDKTSDDSGKTTGTTDSSATAQPVGQLLTTLDPIAALLPVAGTITGTPTTAGNANAPLAIAAAAIAATSSTAASLTAVSDQTKTDGAANGATTTGAATNDTAHTDAGKTPAQGVAIDPKATQLTPTEASASPDVSLLMAAGTTGTTKAGTAGSSPTTASQTKTTTNAATGAQASTDPSATAATTSALQNGPPPQLAVDARPGTHVTPVDAVKADGNGTSAPSTTDHSQTVPNVQASGNSADAGAQLAGVPQQFPATAPGAPTGNFSVTQATGAAVPISGLAVTIAATAQSGKTSFELRLDPADLGRIDVRINVDNNGQVTSHLTVEKPETLSMLRQDAPQLQQALNDAGLKTGSGGLQFSLRDQSSSGQNNPGNQNGGQPQRLVVTQEDTAPPAIAGRSYGRMLGSSSGVDIRV